MPGNTSMAVAPAAGAGEPGSGSGETARHAAPRGAGRPSYELLSKYRGVLMGVQILLIMAFHYTEDLSNAADHFNGPAQVFYDYIGSSGVDMFLMISGSTSSIRMPEWCVSSPTSHSSRFSRTV